MGHLETRLGSHRMVGSVSPTGWKAPVNLGAIFVMIILSALLVGCHDVEGVVSVLAARNLSAADLIVVVDGVSHEIPSHSDGIVATFSGPSGVQSPVEVRRSDCSLVGSVQWDKASNLLLTVDAALKVLAEPGLPDPSGFGAQSPLPMSLRCTGP